MSFRSIEWKGRRLTIEPPPDFQPVMDDESGQLLVLADESLSIHVFARSRGQLADELAESPIALVPTESGWIALVTTPLRKGIAAFNRHEPGAGTHSLRVPDPRSNQ